MDDAGAAGEQGVADDTAGGETASGEETGGEGMDDPTTDDG